MKKLLDLEDEVYFVDNKGEILTGTVTKVWVKKCRIKQGDRTYTFDRRIMFGEVFGLNEWIYSVVFVDLERARKYSRDRVIEKYRIRLQRWLDICPEEYVSEIMEIYNRVTDV